MALTTQAGAVSGRPLKFRYGPAVAKRARTLLPGMMAMKEREKDRLLSKDLTEQQMAQRDREFMESQGLAKDQFRYQQNQADKAEDIGLIGMGTDLAIAQKRNSILPGMATAPTASMTNAAEADYAPGEDPDLMERGADASASESAFDYSDQGDSTWQDDLGESAGDPAVWGRGMSGGLIGAGIGRRFSKGKTWGSIAGGTLGGAAMAYFGGDGSMMDAVIGGLGGGGTGGLMDMIL